MATYECDTLFQGVDENGNLIKVYPHTKPEFVKGAEDVTNEKLEAIERKLEAASSTIPGTIKLGSDTVQTVAAGAPSEEEGRSYPIQKNADGQGVVNVPWTDTAYSAMTQSEAEAGTSEAARLIAPKTLKNVYIPRPTTARDLNTYNIDIYVSPSGNDTNWGESTASAVKTLSRARDIAQMCGGTGYIQIFLAPGTYTQNTAVAFEGIARSISIIGDINNREAHVINTTMTGEFLSFPSCGYVNVSGFTINYIGQQDDWRAIIMLWQCFGNIEWMTLNYTQPQTGTNSAAIMTYHGTVFTTNSITVNNARNILFVVRGGSITSTASAINGSGNTIGANCTNGVIRLNSNFPSGVVGTQTSRTGGGVIFIGNTII